MRRFRSLLIDQVDVKMPGLHILTFALHRHLPELSSVEPHQHTWSQVILYLSGGGTQSLGNLRARVSPATLVVVPPQISHAFDREDCRAPLCLMVNFRFERARGHAPSISNLGRSELAVVSQHVTRLSKLHRSSDPAARWESGLLVSQTLFLLLRAAGWIERKPAVPEHETEHRLDALLTKIDVTAPLGDAIRQSGYQRDYLNRLIKRETGLTLGQYRAQKRLALAKQLLERGWRMSAVATAAGLPDQSYFSRWFRRQTGLTPTGWAAHHSAHAS